MSPLLYRTAIAVGAVLVIVVVSLVVFQPRRGAVKRRIAERVERVERAEQMAVEQARAQKEVEREALQEQAGIARLQREEAEREELAHEEQQRLAAEAERDLEGRRRRAAEQAQRERERRKVEQERLDAAQGKAEEEHRLAAEMQLQREAEEQAEREKRERKKAAEAEATALAAQASDELDAEKEDDDTPEVETDSTIDNVEARRGWRFSGDLRPIYDAERDEADGSTVKDGNWGVRWRVGAEWGIIKQLRAGARLAGICSIDDCDPDFVMQTATPGANGLLAGQITIDQLYLHGFRKGRFDVAVGRLQTRFVLRGGVYAKSLDRNDSNNVNVTWTDGMHATVRGLRGWATHFVLQRNASDGTGSIRRGLLDFDDESARNTYFIGTENIGRWGSVVQRGFDVSYLPVSLLKDGDPDGRREDYWGLVGRLAVRWPQRREGPRMRAGLELGYAPETPTNAAVDLDGSGDADGLAWNVVISAMEFKPSHSIGLNYGRTGPAWYLSPQYRPNEELIELRYQWRPKRFPLLEARVRRREDLEQEIGTLSKASDLDMYVRLTWEFTIKDFPADESMTEQP